jgi:hypothetical protein
LRKSAEKAGCSPVPLKSGAITAARESFAFMGGTPSSDSIVRTTLMVV